MSRQFHNQVIFGYILKIPLIWKVLNYSANVHRCTFAQYLSRFACPMSKSGVCNGLAVVLHAPSRSALRSDPRFEQIVASQVPKNIASPTSETAALKNEQRAIFLVVTRASRGINTYRSGGIWQ